MPVHNQINPSTGTPQTAPPGDASIQGLCTCPSSDDITMQDTLAASPGGDVPSTLLGQPAPHTPPHLSTCALHSNTLAQLKQKAKLRQQLELQRKRNPFEPARVTPTSTFHLYAGSKFRGKQRSGSQSYDVMVDIKHVDLNESLLCGYLHINGLTEEYPELTTYFEAEIIGPKHSFLTRKWDADEFVDEEHWTRFDPFISMASSVFYGFVDHDDEDDEDEGMSCTLHRHYDPQKYDHRNEDVVFMRWKEHFLVPDHRVRGISGASFAGFYYICYSKVKGEISGFYYHESSEKFQELLLTHVEERSFGSFEFR